jgi:hypothetical protein
MARMLASFESVEDYADVVTFFPTIGRKGTIAFTLRPGVHQNYAVTGAKQESRVANHPAAIVGDAMKQQHPVAA